jgi:hypothetical protein
MLPEPHEPNPPAMISSQPIPVPNEASRPAVLVSPTTVPAAATEGTTMRIASHVSIEDKENINENNSQNDVGAQSESSREFAQSQCVGAQQPCHAGSDRNIAQTRKRANNREPASAAKRQRRPFADITETNKVRAQANKRIIRPTSKLRE